ncbi:MAG: O-antigen ligase family protein [Pseudomonadota bacterium]
MTDLTASSASSEAPAPAARSGLNSKATWKNGWTIWVPIFLIATFQPMTLNAGGIFFTGSRLVCFLIMVPLLIAWLRGISGRIMMADVLLMAFTLWMILSLAINQGANTALNFGISQMMEIMGPYLLARMAIRNIESFHHFTRWLIGLTLFVLPFATIEAFFDRQPLRMFFDAIPGFGIVTPVNYGTRLGLTRAQVSFEHPILYGVIVSMGFSLAWVGLRGAGVSGFGRAWRAAVSFLATFFSLSSCALASVMMQILLIGWDTVMQKLRKRWYILVGMMAFFYVVLDILSNRGPIILAISYLTFSGATAWNRVLIWRYGTDEVWRYPILGQGLFADWERPDWMVASIDNYWLLLAMRYGLPGIILILTALVLLLRANWRESWDDNPAYAACRDAYIFTVVAVFVAFATVAAFSVAQSLLYFLLGSGVWLIQAAEAKRAEAAKAEAAEAEPDDDMGPLEPPDSATVPPLTEIRSPRDGVLYSRFAPRTPPASQKSAAKARQPKRIERKPRPGVGPKQRH